MHTVLRTDAKNQDFNNLVVDLNKFLSITDGDDHAFYNQYNKLDDINYVVVIYQGINAIGCGAIKVYDNSTYEIKRMYVRPDSRGQKIGATILESLETWAKELSGQKCILETGIRQTSAIRLYQREGYHQTPNYGQYIGVSDSLCFAKNI